MNRRILSLTILLSLIFGACGSNTPATPANLFTVNIAYAASADAWIAPMIAQFNATKAMTADNKQIAIKGTPLGAEDMVAAMVGPNPPYVMLIPEDKVWIDVLAARRTAHGDPALNFGTCTPIATSPVVMVTWQSMARTLGWPDRDFTWKDISELALSPSAWKGYDHPEWGTLTYGHAHPILSNGGLAATLGEAYGAGPLTVNDINSDQTKSYVRVVERSVSRYNADSSSLIKTMADKGQTYLHVAVGYESDVVANHKGNDPLVAIYPGETFAAQYTTCVVNTDPNATAFATYLAGADAQKAAVSYGFRPIDPTTKLSAPFDGDHGVDPNAKYKVIPMPSADVIRAVQDIWSQLKRPLNIAMIIDVSGSMRDDGKIEGVRTAAAAFVNRLGDDDQFALYTFSSNFSLVVKPGRVGVLRNDAVTAIQNLQPNGETFLYGTALQVRQGFKASSQYINAIVLLTDGQDTTSNNANIDLDKAVAGIKAAKGSVFFYTIGYGNDADGDVLTQIANAGNGSYYHSDPNTINQVYLDIASQFGGSRGLGR
jgi:Ca-activated chloride channel family protein